MRAQNARKRKRDARRLMCERRTGEAAVAEKVAFLGLGVMGREMAAWLSRKGHDVTVWNRTYEKAHAFAAEHKARVVETPALAAQDASFVFTCVGNDDHLQQVMFAADGVLENAAPGTLLVDHTTSSAALARELSRQAMHRGLAFLDAPVSGGQVGAQNGTLTVMVGGSETDFDKATPLISGYAKQLRLLGPAGSGQLAKMVNQICIAGVLQGLAEGLHFAEMAGLDASDVVSVISQGAAASWQMEQRHKTMIEGSFDFGFAVEWMRKDLGLALQEGRRNGATLPVTALVDQFYADVEALGGQRWDTSSLIARLRERRKDRLDR
jgi:3-hydroxyisobutyrate dehydrogenase-like beta-hydroxyacid dehydrogenase